MKSIHRKLNPLLILVVITLCGCKLILPKIESIVTNLALPSVSNEIAIGWIHFYGYPKKVEIILIYC